MKRSLWITTLMVTVLALAGAAAADAPKGCSGGGLDAAGLSGPRWGCGSHGHAVQAHGCGMQARGCGMQAPGCGMQAPGCGMAASKCGMKGKAPGCGMQAAGCAKRARCDMGAPRCGGGPRPAARCEKGMRGGRGPRGGPDCCPQRGRDCCPQGGPRRQLGCGSGPGPEAMAKLELTPAQQEKLAALHERAMKLEIQAQADLRIARMDLEKLMRAENPDGRAVDAQIDKVAGLRAAIQKTRVAAKLEAHSVFTPEQQKKLQEMGGGMHPGMWPGAGGPGDKGGCPGPGPQGSPGGPPDDDEDI